MAKTLLRCEDCGTRLRPQGSPIKADPDAIELDEEAGKTWGYFWCSKCQAGSYWPKPKSLVPVYGDNWVRQYFANPFGIEQAEQEPCANCRVPTSEYDEDLRRGTRRRDPAP